MAKIVLKAENRTTIRRQLGPLRREGFIPAVVYGKGKAVANVQLSAHETILTLRDVSPSTVVDLDVEGKIYKVRVQDIQRHPVRSEIVHIDFITAK